MNQNCWDFKKCGREPGGIKVSELGVCAAATATKLNNTNSGKNGGRSCWVVAGTLCGGVVQGIYAKKMQNCMVCEFYKNVKSEENVTNTYMTSTELLKKLQS